MKRTFIIILSTATLATAGLAGYATAELGTSARTHKGPHILHKMDSNQDGILTRQELTTAKTAKAAKIDRNQDGILSLEEFQAEQQKRRQERMMRRLDTDGDGTITVAEFIAHDGLFARFDANGDGQLTADELPRRGRHGKGLHGQGGHGGYGGDKEGGQRTPAE